MRDSSTRDETVLHLVRRMPAPRERVFHAWTDPEAMRQWCGDEGGVISRVEVDLRVGGRYLIEMQELDSGTRHIVVGTYLEIDAPKRLVYTWSWQAGGMDVGETRVTVEFVEAGKHTELRLMHARFPSAYARDDHAHVWTGVLERLASLLAQGDVEKKT